MDNFKRLDVTSIVLCWRQEASHVPYVKIMSVCAHACASGSGRVLYIMHVWKQILYVCANVDLEIMHTNMFKSELSKWTYSVANMMSTLYNPDLQVRHVLLFLKNH